jgi:iron complex transport system ATP-binding protein
MDIISKIKENGKKTIIVVSHNINLASEFGEEIFFLKNGNIVIKGKANEVINEKTLKEIFDANVRVVKNPISQNPLFVYSK